MSSIRFSRVHAIALLVCLAGCKEVIGVGDKGGSAAPRTITPTVLVSGSGPTRTVTLQLEVRGDAVRVGSYTGTLRFDPAALAFDGEVDLADGVLRAANPDGGQVRLAGASASGIDGAHLAAYRFIVKDPARRTGLRFDLAELHEVTRADLRPSVLAGATP